MVKYSHCNISASPPGKSLALLFLPTFSAIGTYVYIYIYMYIYHNRTSEFHNMSSCSIINSPPLSLLPTGKSLSPLSLCHITYIYHNRTSEFHNNYYTNPLSLPYQQVNPYPSLSSLALLFVPYIRDIPQSNERVSQHVILANQKKLPPLSPPVPRIPFE